MEEHILTAMDYARREKCRSVAERIEKLARRNGFKAPDGKTSGKAVQARVNRGRWIADCECGGAEAVSREEPVFFCFSCGNEANKGKLRGVLFPEDANEVEKALLERKLKLGPGRDEIVKAMQAVPETYHREWAPGESAKDIRAQNMEVSNGAK